MITKTGNVGVVALVLVLAAGCASDAAPALTASTAATSTPSSTGTTAPVESTLAPRASTEPTGPPAVFPVATFAAISEDPVSDELAAQFQAILEDAARPDGGGITATVMTAGGTWSGAVGTADGVRDIGPDDQLSIGSITKSILAAQVMQMAEAGELELDDPATDHLPADFAFDTNEATIRDLLGMRSGIPDYLDALFERVVRDPQREWTLAETLELVGPERAPAGDTFEYSNTNYILIGLIIEHVRGRPLADVLRPGVLSGEGLERLIYQPDESPTPPMAMPGGQSDALETGGGFLPSLAGVSADGPAGSMASDAPTLARWWTRLCGGEIVSEASLAEMTAFRDGYGLGLSDETVTHGVPAVGHSGYHIGYVAWAACLVEEGAVVVVMMNREDFDQLRDVADALGDAARQD